MSNVEVMKKALEVMHYLEALNSDTQQQKVQTITELKGAISEAEKQGPVAEYRGLTNGGHYIIKPMGLLKIGMLLYTEAQTAQQEWVGLSERDIRYFQKHHRVSLETLCEIEARLKEKNTKKGK
jgi:hypothetical protein